MVKQSAESQFKCRALKALADGKDIKVRGEAHRAIFEDLKKEVAMASSSAKNEKQEGRGALSEDTPGVQELYVHDGLGAEMPYAGSDRDSYAAPDSAEPLAVQPDAEQGHASDPGVQDSRFNDSRGLEMPDIQSGRGDTGPQPAEPADPQLLSAECPPQDLDEEKADDTQDELRHSQHAPVVARAELNQPEEEHVRELRRVKAENCILSVENEMLGIENENSKKQLANSLPDVVQRLRQDLAEARAELERLQGTPLGRLGKELDEAHTEINRLTNENNRLWLENEGLVSHNKELKTQLEEARRSDTKADPEVEALRAEMERLELEKGTLQGVLAQQVARNHEQAATRSQSADARPAKSLKAGFGVGDLVYTASEYWGLVGKHPKKYDHRTCFVIVKQGLQPGCWDLCAKKHMRTEPKEDAEKWLPPGSCEAVCQRARLQSLYEDGFLGDVPALLLSLRPSRPGPKPDASPFYVDLTKK